MEHVTSQVSEVAYVIQTALTPVFLLAGTAGFLNVFSTRLGRVSDRLNEITDLVRTSEGFSERRMAQLSYLRRRTLALEASVVLATASGLCTCLATLGLLGGAIRSEIREYTLFWFFGGAVITLFGAFLTFLFEMMTAARSLLRQIAEDQEIVKKQM
ncbi:DUF2721 domain-containing protein [Rhizobiaceae bacterium n13]|uniref:DUF2721 domain-containing protein n=1 Tax=Ferirhizobium litorale TaxID=2927786 RepID=A0AAE3U265_9HYPH|nr:DUF2721 domain-containing protein [Fererhizobium litorale]MDI7863136.1 DUF2721 domain-containing protein [Fererhizobium litorale]MDI7923186.1 DUF2721 domain-containing protein [Fererhizobium litorale]